MISTSLRVFLFVAVIIYFALILFFLKKRALMLKYTLLWIFSGISMTVLIAFPQVLDWLIYIVDIKSPVNGLFAFAIFFVMIILMSLTSIVSKQNHKIKTLIQEVAILEKRIRELENKEV